MSAPYVKPTQADRDDAASYLELLGLITGRCKDAILRGKWDQSRHVQWFARRREAAALRAKAVGETEA